MRWWWWLLGVVLLGTVGLLLLQLFGPNPNVIISKQTTFINAPLAEDGLPNYALAILEQQREGVTPKNNGARIFWQAMGPATVSVKQYADLCQELDVERNATEAYLTDIASDATAERLATWIAGHRADGSLSAEELAEQAVSAELLEEVHEFLALVSKRPWTADDAPPLADWVAENEAPLDLLVQAAAKPRFFSPPPNVLENPHSPVVEMLLPHAQEARNAVRSLSARSMHRVANRQYEQAWQDSLACWRFGAHIGAGPTIVEKLVGIALRGVAKDCTLALLQAEDLPESLVREIVADLNAQPTILGMADSINQIERLMLLDCTMRQVTRRLGGIDNGDVTGVVTVVSIDPNVPLRIANQWYDRLARVTKTEDRAKRSELLATLDADLQALANRVKSKAMMGLFSRAKRGEAVGEIMVSLMLPAIGAVMEAEDRDEANITLARVAALIALYRIQHHEYPASLGELTPALIAELPLDLYSGKAFVYERRDDGYLLYSVFQNQVDDGGNDLSGDIIDGEWVPQKDAAPVAPDESDLALRLPLPELVPIPTEKLEPVDPNE